LDHEIAALVTQIESIPKKTLKKAIKTSAIGDSIRKRQLKSKKKKLSSSGDDLDSMGVEAVDREIAKIEQRQKARKESLG
jgi:hypothetical protein